MLSIVPPEVPKLKNDFISTGLITVSVGLLSMSFFTDDLNSYLSSSSIKTNTITLLFFSLNLGSLSIWRTFNINNGKEWKENDVDKIH
jgi:hypothetical protein